ncbi:MAG: protein kinase [Myxococcales bacterium]|nr:protein kinase [Myxococcales bacterium]
MQRDDEDGFGSAAGPPSGESGAFAAASGAFDARLDDPAAPHPFAVGEGARYPEGTLLGEGGMGRVTAVRDGRLNRVVALKRLSTARTGPGARARLAQEAWITAHLEHPGIVPVYDVGVDASGELFYTMRLIRGRSLAALIADRPTARDRLGLLRAFRDACEAVGYAHALGVVHRDLKPQNIMVGSFGETQVADWGLARVLGGDERPAAGMVPAGHGASTVFGTVVGSPAYMAPEQARAAPPTPRSDVYSLGATLLELLSGRPPFVGLSGAELLHRLRAGERPDVEAAAPDAPPALLAIARRALAADPASRYPDAKALADEVTAWIDGRLVGAHAYSRWELARRFARAQRVPLTIGAVALALLVALGAVAWRRTAAERDRAVEAEAAAQIERRRGARHLAGALLEKALAAARVEARAEAELLAAHALGLLGESAEARGVLARFGAGPRPRRLGRVARPPCPQPVLAPAGDRLLCLGAHTAALYDLPAATLRWRLDLGARHAAFAGDGAILFEVDGRFALHDAASGRRLGDAAGTLQAGSPLVSGPAALALWAGQLTVIGADGAQRAYPPGPPGGPWLAPSTARVAAWRPNGDVVVVCEGGEVVIARADGTHHLLTTLPMGNPVWADAPRALDAPAPAWATISRVAVTPDGRRAVLGTWKGAVLTLDLETGRVERAALAAGGPVRDLAVAPDGARVVVTTERGGPGVWHLGTGQWEGRLPADARGRARFLDAARLVTVGPEAISTWALPADATPLTLHARTGVASVAWSADGAWLASGHAEGELAVWRARDGARVAAHDLGALVVGAVAFAPERPLLVAYGGGKGDLARLEPPGWTPTFAPRPLAYGRHLALLRGDQLLRATLYTVSGGRLDEAFGEAGPRAWDAGALGLTPGVEVADLRASPDRRHAVVAYADGRVFRVAVEAGLAAPEALGALPGVTALDVGDGGQDVLALVGGTVALYRGDLAAPASSFSIAPPPVALAWSADRRWIAAGMLDGALRLYDARDGRLMAVEQAHRERAAALAFAPDGRTLVTGGWDKTVRRWSLEGLQAPAADVGARVAADWGLTLDEALAARVD